ncbi:MAG: cardiolipin synthase [Janthinobacterium sp.]|jgi:cardiolipin synthase
MTTAVLSDDGLRWTFPLSALEHGAFVFCGLLLYILATRIGRQRRHPSTAVAWVLSIAVVPYLGVPLFLLFGRRKFSRPHGHVPTPHGLQEKPAWATGLLAALDLPAPTHNSSACFHEDGHQSQAALLALIANARHSIDLCTFILAADATGNALGAALMQSARRGVRVRVLIDAIGSLRYARSRLHALRDAGVEVRWFMPVLHNPLRGRTNLRNHRKFVVCDGSALWSGGRNFADDYFVDEEGENAWPDLSFIVQGPLAQQVRWVFEHDWHGAGGRSQPMPSTLPALVHAPDGIPAQLLPSGPDHADDTLHALLLTAAYHARERIVAVSPYFVPDDALLAAWCIACRRDVSVTLLLPARSNHRLADLARERSLRELANAGAHIYFFPQMIHAKAVIVDNDVALCGSANLDGRSFFLNFELTTAFYGPAQIDWLAHWIERKVKLSRRYVVQEPAWWRDMIEGMVRALGFQL